MPEITIPEIMLPFIEKPKRFKIAFGGRGSGKSMTFADISLMDAQVKGIKTACFREFQTSIDDSVLSLLTNEIRRLELTGFEAQNQKILLNGEDAFKFRGLARNPEGIKSMDGFQRFWVEEAQTISSRSLKALTPTLRTDDSEIWMSANLNSSADPFSQRFIKPFQKELDTNGYYEDDLHLIIRVNYMDNPFFPEVLEKERQYDYENLSTAEYRHIWLGEYNDEVENSIIPVDWFDAAINAHVKLGFKPRGIKIASHDPSDRGDAKGFAMRHGSVFTDICENTSLDVNDGCDWAMDKSYDADYFVWDCDGLGLTLKRQVNDTLTGKHTKAQMFKGSEGAENPNAAYQPIENETNYRSNKQTFRNKRAQYYWRLRDRFHNTYKAVVKGEFIAPDELISICDTIEAIDAIRAEVCRIPRKPNGSGLIQIMSKEDMKAKQISSPNMADCMMMAMFEPPVNTTVNIDFESEF